MGAGGTFVRRQVRSADGVAPLWVRVVADEKLFSPSILLGFPAKMASAGMQRGEDAETSDACDELPSGEGHFGARAFEEWSVSGDGWDGVIGAEQAGLCAPYSLQNVQVT